jgi:hypothetical protein
MLRQRMAKMKGLLGRNPQRRKKSPEISLPMNQGKQISGLDASFRNNSTQRGRKSGRDRRGARELRDGRQVGDRQETDDDIEIAGYGCHLEAQAFRARDHGGEIARVTAMDLNTDIVSLDLNLGFASDARSEAIGNRYCT